MSEIADLVFAENSTLLQVLDQLQVPELSGEVTQIDSRLTQLTAQVSQLGQIIDTNQLNNQAQFNAINTTLGAQTDQINELVDDVLNVNESVTNLSAQVNSLGQEFGDLSTEVGQFDTRIKNNTDAIALLNVRYNSLNVEVSQLSNDVSANRILINQQQTQINGLQTTVNSYTLRIEGLEKDIAAIKGLPGIISQGVNYIVNNAPTSNPWVWALYIYGNYGVRCRFGQEYQAILNGSVQYVKFLDQFGVMSVTSNPRNMAVNVGLQRFAYRTGPTASWVLTTVNVSKDNNA